MSNLLRNTDEEADPGIPSLLHLENGRRPSWLLVPYGLPTWTVTDTGNKPNRTISFHIALPNGHTTQDYPHLLDSTMRVVYGVRTGPLANVASGSVQTSIALNFLFLVRWMTLNNIDRFEQITSADVREYAEQAAYGHHQLLNTEGILQRYLEKVLTTFSVNDSPEVRRNKAISVLPTYRGGPSGRQVNLHRMELLRCAGLEGLGCANSPLTALLDEFETFLGLDVDISARRRINASRTVDDFGEEPCTEEHLRRLLMPFEYLYRHRRYLDDAIQRPPFPGSSPRSEARRWGKAVARTKTIPIPQAAYMIERSIRWVMDYAPDLLLLKEKADSTFEEQPGEDAEQRAWLVLRETLDSFKPQKTGPSQPYPLLPSQRQSTDPDVNDEIDMATRFRHGMSLPNALTFLMTACAVVIAAFSARRAAEIIGLKLGCIEPDELGKPWLRVFIHKWPQTESLIPVPEVVVQAIRVLERLSARARKISGQPFLFQMNYPGTDRVLCISDDGFPVFPLGTHLKRFGYFLDVPSLDDGSRWTFRPHQFRRFFAILYVWVYELGDLGALSYFLHHPDLEATRRYTSDDELGRILFFARREHTAQVLAKAALGQVTISGALGERLRLATKRLYDRMTIRLQVVPEQKFVQRVSRFVERTGITLQAVPWGFCGYRPLQDTKLAKCITQTADTGKSAGPDIAAASPSVCAECMLSVRSPVFVPYISRALDMHRALAQDPSTPPLLAKASKVMVTGLLEYIASVQNPPTSDAAVP